MEAKFSMTRKEIDHKFADDIIDDSSMESNADDSESEQSVDNLDQHMLHELQQIIKIQTKKNNTRWQKLKF